jgi:hypothetical protein
MKRWLLVGLAVAAVCGIGVWLVYRAIFSNEELVSKPESSIVQAVEWHHRDNPGNKIEVVKVDDYSLVGIPVHDSRKEIWIMLNPRNPPYYKQIPQGTYRLSKEDLKTILGSGVVTSTVETCLESHIEDREW